jgi:hypothetical protein
VQDEGNEDARLVNIQQKQVERNGLRKQTRRGHNQLEK